MANVISDFKNGETQRQNPLTESLNSVMVALFLVEQYDKYEKLVWHCVEKLINDKKLDK